MSMCALYPPTTLKWKILGSNRFQMAFHCYLVISLFRALLGWVKILILFFLIVVWNFLMLFFIPWFMIFALRLFALLEVDIFCACREEINRRNSIYQHRKENNQEVLVTNGHWWGHTIDCQSSFNCPCKRKVKRL